MSELTSAEENLRVIRTLMERSTVYRALSAPGALIAGVVATVAGVASWHWPVRGSATLHFVLVWGGVLAVAIAVNLWSLHRESARRGAPFFSRSMRMALAAMAPPLAVGFLFSILLATAHETGALPVVWMIFYGLALLATGHFAPRSLVFLGLTFATAGLAMVYTAFFGHFVFSFSANLLMAGSFGLLHIIYALLAWPRKP